MDDVSDGRGGEDNADEGDILENLEKKIIVFLVLQTKLCRAEQALNVK